MLEAQWVVFRGRSLLVVCWAHCSAWCSILGSILLWGEFFSGTGDFSFRVNMGLTPFPKNCFRWEYKVRSSLCTLAFHRTDSKDPGIHVLDRWMPATKTHPASTIHEDGMWLSQWLDSKTGHICKSLTQNGEPQCYSMGIQKKKQFCLFSWLLMVQATGKVLTHGPICSDTFTHCHSEIEVVAQACKLSDLITLTDTKQANISTDTYLNARHLAGQPLESQLILFVCLGPE